MHPVVFSAAWFAQHQVWLLRLLAWPLVGRLLRQVLAIRPHDLGWGTPIVALYPHAYTVEHPDGSYTTDFRTHAKFAKRLYYQLLPLWRLLHMWDMAIANPFVPVLNAGFDTLTQYPDLGDPGTTTVDGTAYRSVASESFATIRGGNGTGAYAIATTDTAPYLAGSSTVDQFSLMQRGLFGFNTSTLGASAGVSAVTFSQWFTGKISNLGDTTVEITAGPTASGTTLASGDFQTIGRVAFATGVSIAGLTTGAYTDVALNAAGVAAVSLTGITKLGTQLGWDLANSFTGTWASGVQTGPTLAFADQTGSANDPKLEVTYTVPNFLLVTLLGTTP